MNSPSVKIGSVVFTFDSWLGRPQQPRPVIEVMTRLGGSKLIKQQLKVEGIATQSTATISSSAATDKASVQELEATWKSMRANFGKTGEWTDENGIVISNFMILDGTRTIKVVDGSSKANMVLNLTCQVDGDDNANSE